MQYLWAFLVGGGICVIGQLLIDLTAMTPARILPAYVVAGVVLSALGLYEPLADFAGAGATVPLLGFGHNLAQGVAAAVQQRGLLGALTGGFTQDIAGMDLELALSALAEVDGRAVTGDVVDTIFHNFCVGK